MRYLHLVWRNLMRKKVRTALTVLSIFVAFTLFGLLIAVMTGFGAGVELAGQDRMILIHKVSLIQLLPEKYGQQILDTEGVSAVAHNTWFGGVYQDPKNFFPQIAVDPESHLDLYPEIELPEERKEAWIGNRRGAIVGRTTAERFGWEVGDLIPIQGNIWRTPDGSAWEFVLEGIYDSSVKGFDKTNFFFHNEYLTETTGFKGQVGWYVLRIDDPERSAEIAEAIDRKFANSPAETKTTTEKAFIQSFANQVGDIAKIVTSVLTVVFFTLLLVAGNTMAQSVRERTGELAVLKTLGFTDVQVMGLVLGESYLLTLIGGGTGLALIVLAVGNIEHMGQLGTLVESMLPSFSLPDGATWTGVALLVAMGFLAGAVPAVQALRLDIVEALRKS